MVTIKKLKQVLCILLSMSMLLPYWATEFQLADVNGDGMSDFVYESEHTEEGYRVLLSRDTSSPMTTFSGDVARPIMKTAIQGFA